MPTTPPSAVLILAAGEGTRMKSATPKVLHEVCGRPLVGHVVVTAQAVAAEHIVVVLGHQRELVEQYLSDAYPEVVVAVQQDQNGTGHAVRVTLAQLADAGIALGSGPVVVVSGDSPLLTPGTLELMLAEHVGQSAAVTVLSAVLDDPTGYGRVLRGADGAVSAIVEHKDADADDLGVREVNSAMYVFDRPFLAEAVTRLSTANAQSEEYLPDLIAMARHQGLTVAAVPAPDPADTLGVNDRAQLAAVGAIMRHRINTAWMTSGVTMVDPAATYVDADVTLEPDCVLEPGAVLRGRTSVAAGAVVGPDSTLIDTHVLAGARVNRVHAESAVIGENANLGPFTYLRPGAHLAEGAKAGAFVEIKNSNVGPGAKVPHLTYVGDADIGAGSNIGASSVFVNYDGVAKHRTTVGEHVRVGSDTMLIAPVTVGDGSYTAAGSVITDDIPPGALAIARGRQRNVAGWVMKNRAGTASATAAVAAQEGEGV